MTFDKPFGLYLSSRSGSENPSSVKVPRVLSTPLGIRKVRSLEVPRSLR
jgi:hypothetical protein